jgi:hypothetical protein
MEKVAYFVNVLVEMISTIDAHTTFLRGSNNTEFYIYNINTNATTIYPTFDPTMIPTQNNSTFAPSYHRLVQGPYDSMIFLICFFAFVACMICWGVVLKR